MRTSLLVAVATALTIAFAGASLAAETESLLIPGIEMRSIDFKVGAWCRYQVVDEAMGERDTSIVYLAVVGSEKTARGTAYWLEVESAAAGAPKAERDAARALIDERIKSMAPGDSLHQFISRFYTRKGDGPVEEGNPKQLRRLSLASPKANSNVTAGHDLTVSTPAGTFVCQSRKFVETDSRDIPSGRVILKQKRSDRVEVYTSPSVPLFHLVKSDIERTRESKTVPPVRGIPETGPKTSRTTSILIAHGTGAKPTIKIR